LTLLDVLKVLVVEISTKFVIELLVKCDIVVPGNYNLLFEVGVFNPSGSFLEFVVCALCCKVACVD
jgi:hypothetical protein